MFFVVRRDGQDLLTRAGNFSIEGDGSLTTDQGLPVLDSTGTPVAIDPTVPWTVTREGEIMQDGARTPLAMVRPQQPGDLVKVGGNMFQALAPTVALPLEQRRVETGVLETSGVNSVGEMMNLITASRAFESNVTLIKSQDQMLGNLISRVLSVR